MPGDPLVEIVLSDLHHVASELSDAIEDHSLRRLSGILRRLLVEGVLQRAWKIGGYARQPMVPAFTLDRVLSRVDRHKILFASAGGAKSGGAWVGAIVRPYGDLSPEVASAIFAAKRPRELSLKDFTEADCVVAEGKAFNRRDVIKFVANRLGGVHLSSEREAKETVLDRAVTARRVLDRPVIYFELLATAQALCASADVRRFVEETSGRPLAPTPDPFSEDAT